MDNTVDITNPVATEAAMAAAKALDSPVRREAAGRYLSSLLTGGRIPEAIAEAKREACANGLTDEEIDAELAAWQAERRA